MFLLAKGKKQAKLIFLAFANKNKVFISKATGLVYKKTMFFYRLVNKAKLYLLISEKVEILAKRKQAKLILLQAYQ